SDDNPAAYLADSCEKDKILFNVNEELEKEQFGLAEILLNENTHLFKEEDNSIYMMDRYEEEIIEYQDYNTYSNITNKKALSDMGWEDSINDKPHEIYIKLDDLVSQHKATLEKKVSIATRPWWLQPIETSTKAYYREFDNFKDTYFCNSVWWKALNSVQYY
ncbi:2420_t:CDS:2, partial [Gigaspora margarita]